MVSDASGGALVIAVDLLVPAMLVAIREAWAKKRDALGWTVNMIVALICCMLAALIVRPIVDIVLGDAGPERSLAAANPLFYCLMLGTMIIITWGALWLVNRLR